MENVKKIGLIAAVAVVIAVGIMLMGGGNGKKPVEKETADEIQGLLVAAGLEESIVQIEGKEITVRYNQPELYSEVDPIVHFGIILGTVSGVAPELEIIKIQTFVEEEAFSEITIKMADLVAYQEGEIDFDTFAAMWEVRVLG